MRGMEAATKDEGIGTRTRERVVNRLIWGEPEGLRGVLRVSPDDRPETCWPAR